jgi:hypothetical protein
MTNINLEIKEHGGYVLVVDNPSFIEKTKNTLLVFLDEEQVMRLRELLPLVWRNTPPTLPGRYAWCRTPNTKTHVFYAAIDRDDGVLRVDHPTLANCTISVDSPELAGWWLNLD